ncbi:hypothetical protein M0R45_000590 [Rubus argutus]|uniref:MHC class I antigen n=1 Tax=Rubus argutus TaxID=59490 RepID=A0AAW1VNW1_RUBAR
MRRYDGREKTAAQAVDEGRRSGLGAQACEVEKKSWIDGGMGTEARGALVNRRCWAEGKIVVVEHGRGDGHDAESRERWSVMMIGDVEELVRSEFNCRFGYGDGKAGN